VTAEALRARTFAELEELGFQPANSLPLPDVDLEVRPPEEIAARLMALDALFTWVAYPEHAAASERVQQYINRNALRDWLTEEEVEIIDLPRDEAHESHVESIGWKLENMWPLAWALGFEPEPNLEAAHVNQEITGPLFREFLPGLGKNVSDLVAKAVPRPATEVIELEYRFYCAHNAVRSAQLGGDTVPEGFHPIIHGGAVHERRHSLTWCLAPETPWDETDLST
jgi:hypothetical protein